MRRPVAIFAAAFAGFAAAVAWSQIPQFPGTLPSNTLVGRLGTGPGPAQAVPFTSLLPTVLGGLNLTQHGIVIGEAANPIAATAAMTNGQLLVGQTSADPLPETLSGDATLANTGALTLATVNSNVGSFGSVTAFPNVTVNGKGLITAASAQTIPSCASDGVHALTNPASGGLACTASVSQEVYLATITASNSASINDATACSGSNCLTGTYTDYKIVFENLVPATNATTCLIQIHSGGAYKTTGYLSTSISQNGAGANNGTVTTGIFCSAAAHTANASPGIYGTCLIFQPSTSNKIMFTCNTDHADSSTGESTQRIGGYWNTAGVVDGFQILFSAGNITSGSIKIYGLVN